MARWSHQASAKAACHRVNVGERLRRRREAIARGNVNIGASEVAGVLLSTYRDDHRLIESCKFRATKPRRDTSGNAPR